MQDADAARRLAILRGESPPPPLPEVEQPADPSDKKWTRRERDGAARKRKRAGEDDTDFEMRVARERAQEGNKVRGELGVAAGREGQGPDVDIVDSRGHIDLIGGVPPRDDDAGEHDGKKREPAMASRHDTFGSLKDELAGQSWYTDTKRRRITTTTALIPAGVAATTTEDREAERGMEAPTKNVWGRDDPKRRGRETARLDANDPLAMMKSGAKKVREVAKERRRDAEERERELQQLRKEERRRDKEERRRRREGARKEENGRDDHHSSRSESRHHRDRRREDGRDDRDRRGHRRRSESEHGRERERDKHHHRRDRDRSRERRAYS
jgi:hypothetical protein